VLCLLDAVDDVFTTLGLWKNTGISVSVALTPPTRRSSRVAVARCPSAYAH